MKFPTTGRKKAAAVLAATGIIFALTASSCDTSERDERDKAQAAKKAASKTSLEITNLQERIKREENPNAIGYVYVLSFGKPFGYYVTKGKVSSAGSQLTPEEDITWADSTAGSVVVDGPQDDGTYGSGDEGIFFFTVAGVMVTTSLDYIHTDQPLEIPGIPKLG